MTKLLVPLVVLSVLVVILSGCGGGGSSSNSSGSSSSTSSSSSSGGSATDGIAVGNCLNDQDFLVQPETTLVNGQSPAGVSFTLTLYSSPAAAKTAAAKKNAKTTAVVENGVVDFHGNPSPYQGAPPAKISKVELAAIKTCIDSSK